MTEPDVKPWRYAIGMFGTSLPINFFLMTMGFYYVDTLSLEVPYFAAAMVAYAIIDAIDNPVYGYLSDRTRTRWGRRRPWLVLGAPALGLSLIAFYSVPTSLTGTQLLVWFVVFAALTETVDSLINVNYGALLPELFPDTGRRAYANGLRQGAGLVAIVVGVAGTPAIVGAIGHQATAVMFALVAVGVILIAAFGSPEDPDIRRLPAPRIRESLRAILGTKTFWWVAITSGAYASAITLVLAAAPFFVKYTLGLPPGSATFFLAAVILSSIAFLAIWTRLVRRRGPLAVWRLSLAILAASFVPMYLASSLPLALAAGLLMGLGYSGVIATMDLIVAALMDADAARTGVHREAMFIAAFGFFNRLNGAVKSLAFLAAFALYGYRSGTAPGPHPGDAARFLMAVFPCVMVLVAATTSRLVHLDAPSDVRATSRA